MESEQGESKETVEEALEVIRMRHNGGLSRTRGDPQAFCISCSPFTKCEQICKTFYLPKIKGSKCYFLMFL